ncbi:ATP-binding protein [Streptomyces sp. NPDC059373]
MDPRNGVPDEPNDERPQAGEAEEGTLALPRVQRQPLVPPTADPAAGTGSGGGSARVVQLVAGDFLLTLNPVDGSEITTCPPEDRPAPVRRTAQERVARQAAARPPAPPGPRGPELPLLEREEERERLARLLSRGRSVRVTGPSGAGRTALLDTVADACDGLAPDGVVRLSGYRRTPSDLLQELFALVYDAEGYRPDRPRLLELLRDVGAVVVVDDLEFGGTALEDLLASVPECAFLMSATPDIAAPASDSLVEEIFLPGLTRIACLELLERAVERPLQDEEAAWAADLWFESEGLPLRFVQAGALLRRRDAQGMASLDGDVPVWDGPADALAENAPYDAVPTTPATHIPLPSLAESAAPAELLASWISESAREALRFAVALGGEIPHQAHLPALVGDTHGDAALGEMVAVGLATPVSTHFRLAAGVRQQLAATGGLAADAAAGGPAGPQAHTAAQHYAWWAGHPSVTPDRVAAEAEAILATLAACRDGGHSSAAVLLARTAAPAFAAALHWSAWERTLRVGQEAARLAGEVAEEAYFHHELGVLALCSGSLDRARTELEASIALRGALADRQGTTVGRRTLALVVDRSGSLAPATTPSGVETPTAGTDASAFPGEAPATIISKRLALSGPGSTSLSRRLSLTPTRRNLATAGAGALLAAVLGTLVTFGTTSNGNDTNTPMNVKPVESAQQDQADNGLPAVSQTPGSTTAPSATGTGTSPAATTAPGATGGGAATTADAGSTGAGTRSPSSSPSPTKKPTHTPSRTPSPSTSTSTSTTPTASTSSSASPSASETTTNTASDPVSTTPVAGDSTTASGTVA